MSVSLAPVEPGLVAARALHPVIMLGRSSPSAECSAFALPPHVNLRARLGDRLALAGPSAAGRRNAACRPTPGVAGQRLIVLL